MGKEHGMHEIAAGAMAALAERARGDAGEQLDFADMLPPIRTPGDAGAAIREEVRANRRGRPPGAVNLATREAKEMFVRLFGDPLLETGRWLLHTPQTLAKELGCTILEAFDRQQRAREAVMPFLHAKVAPTDASGRAVPFFQLILGALEEAGAGDRAPWLADPEIRKAIEHETERNQGVSEAGAPVSHEPVTRS